MKKTEEIPKNKENAPEHDSAHDHNHDLEQEQWELKQQVQKAPKRSHSKPNKEFEKGGTKNK